MAEQRTGKLQIEEQQAGKQQIEEQQAGEQQTLEEIFRELEEIIGKMQQREVSLEDSFRLYEHGIQKLKACNDKIDYVEKQMLLLNGQGELEPLDEI